MIDINRMFDCVTDSNPFEPADDEAERIAAEQVRAEAADKEAKRKANEQNAKSGPKPDAANQSPLRPAGELLDAYLSRIKSGSLPQLYRLGDALDGIEVGSELVTLVGAPPGFGKTAMASQILFETLENNPGTVGYLLNAEMGFDSILRRELTRLTRIRSDYIRFGLLTENDEQEIAAAAWQLREAMARLSVYPEPDISSLVDLQSQPPGLVIVDYLQKFSPADKDLRVGVGRVMDLLRKLAKSGHAVLALSATKRDAKGGHGSADLSLSSFKESGECEFQADSAYVLRDDGAVDGKEYIRAVTLAHVKNRHGAKSDRQLRFDMPAMRFDAVEPERHSEFDEYETEDGGFSFGGGE